jgi:hypothetical protein
MFSIAERVVIIKHKQRLDIEPKLKGKIIKTHINRH